VAFLDLSLLTGLSIVGFILISLARTRDPLAPAVIFGAMLLFQYVFYPIRFELTVPIALRGMLDDEQLVFAQSLFLGGVICLLSGLVIGSGVRRRGAPLFGGPALTTGQRLAARKTMRVLAAIALGSALYASITAGRLAGNVASEFGYVNEAYHFSVPATAMYLLSVSHRRLTRKDLFVCVVLMSPLLIRGLFVAKRGPTLIFILGLSMAWFLAARRRPSLPALAAGGAAAFFLVALLFFNREAIWRGQEIDTDIDPLGFASINPGNDYIYGAAMANVALERNDHDYGGRFLITFLVRPVPSQIWPTKYSDASNFLNVGFYSSIGKYINESYLYFVSYPILGWQIAPGAYWGIVTDMFWEFRYFGFIALYAGGFVIGSLYRRSSQGVLAFLIYVVTMSVTPYIVAQDLGESGFRILFMTVPGILLFKFFGGQRTARTSSVGFPAGRARSGPAGVRGV